MRRVQIKVEVFPGMFEQERYVSFHDGEKKYSLLVDASEIASDNWLTAYLIDEQPTQSLIELPRDTFEAGTRVWVSKELIKPKQVAA